MMNEPRYNALRRYKHDCNGRQFLGQHKEYDLYYCARAESDMGGSVLARYSSEGSDYSSQPLSLLLLAAMNELAY